MLRSLFVALVGLLLGGCVYLGWRFGPGFAVDDPDIFAAPPVVVRRGEDYFLVWTQGTQPFFFEPVHAVKEGRLVFALSAMASSGDLRGRRREMKIEGAAERAVLQRGGAFWWGREPEPRGTFVRLAVVTEASSERP